MTKLHALAPRPLRRGLGLIRVSKERDGMTSPDVQRHAIQAYADSHGIAITGWVEGIDESGSRAKSAWWAKLDAAVGQMEAGDVDVIVVWKFSRTARHRLRWAVALDRVDSAGGSLESATEQTDATPSGRFARGMLGELNAYQAELIGETWREAHERRVRKGLPPTGGPRFGYLQEQHSPDCSGSCARTRPHGRYVPDPDTAPVLRELYSLYLSGWGYSRLAGYLSDRTPDRGRRWTEPGIASMLDSGFAAGLLGHSEAAGTTRRAPMPWLRRYSPGAHEAIIDENTWRAYVAHREARNGRRVRGVSSPYMLSGLVRCGDCGGAMHGKRTNGRFTYTCTRAERSGGVRKVSIVAWRADEAAEQWLHSLAADADKQIAAQASHASKRRDTEAFARRARERVVKGEERLASLTIKLADELISDAAYRVAAEAVQADIDAAQAVLRAAAANPAEERAAAEVPRDLDALWPTLGTEQRNLLLRPLLAYVLIAPARHRGDKGDRCTIVPRWEDAQVGT